MSVFGQILAHAGLAIRLNASSTTWLTHDIAGDPTSTWQVTWPTNPPGSTQLLNISSTGVLGYTAAASLGTVTSVALSLPSFITVSGSPVTTSGTLTGTLASQSANAVFAAPDGSAGTPTFRSLVAADIPSLLASKISNFDTQVRTNRLDQMAAPTASVAFNSQKITGLAEPTNPQDAATKNYVDSAITSARTYKGTADASAATPAAATGTAVFNNGDLYRINVAGSVAFGFLVNVGDFVIYNGSGWNKIDNTDPSVSGTTNRITSTPTSDTSYTLDIAATYAGQTSITTLGTIGTGVWNGTPVPLLYGGTGATTAAGARTALVAAGIAQNSFTNATLTAGVLSITHNLSNQWPQVTIYDNNNRIVFPDEVTGTSSSVSTVDLTTFGTLTGTWRYVVIG